MNYKKGIYLVGTVSGIENYGIFVIFEDGYTGLIHISEVADFYIKNLDRFVSIGDKIKVKVVEVDEEKKQFKLSIKNFNYKNLKNNRQIIKETANGFSPLGNNLNMWIKNRLIKINKKNIENIVDK